jgi:cob(I)alamin adenosyltransferase
VALSHAEEVPPLLLQYLNRLSDLLFVSARALNRHAGGDDVLWEQGKNRQ